MRRAPLLLLLLAGVLVGGTSSAVCGPDESGTMIRGELGTRLDEALQLARGGGYWGVALVAVGGKIVLAKGYGYADYRSTPNTPATLFEAGSITKSVTAVALLRLEQKGLLRAGDTVGEVFPWVRADRRGITLDQLLTHTSGLLRYFERRIPPTWSRRRYLELLFEEPLFAEPGTRFAYGNPAYTLLAAVIDAKSAGTFEAFVRREVFARAHMTDTGFVGDEALRRTGRAAVRLRRVGDPQSGFPAGTAVDGEYGWGQRGACCLVTTALDLLRLDRALRGDAILDAKMRARLYEPAREGYARGWMVDRLAGGRTRVRHSGEALGFESHFVRYLEEDVVIVLWSNPRSRPDKVLGALERTLEVQGALKKAGPPLGGGWLGDVSDGA